MKTRLFVLAVAVCVAIECLAATTANAGLGIDRSGKTSAGDKNQKFDGVWVGKFSVSIIKQLKGSVVLQGKDKGTTWSALGSIKGNTLICRGRGVTNSGTQFAYESTIELRAGQLIDTWKAIYPDGKILKGKETLRAVSLAQLRKSQR